MSMWRNPHLDEIRRLDPERDHQRIVYLITCYEFPFDLVRSLEIALFRTFASPSISEILETTGELVYRPQKRYDDTNLILSEIVESGVDGERGASALERMNELHHRFPITNQDYLYVLSTFVCEPVRWNARFGWRPFTQQERDGLFVFWRELGKRMGIRDIPGTYEELEAFNSEYERTQFHYEESNQIVAESSRDMILGWFLPKPARRLGRPFLYAMLDKPLLDAIGFPQAPAVLRVLVPACVRLRSRIVWLLPPRRKPKLLTARQRSYPHGYLIEELGPRPYGKKKPATSSRDG